MATRLEDNLFKGFILIILFLALILSSMVADAQSRDRASLYKGFVAGFGIHTSQISSSIAAIDATALTQSGGQVGLVLGNHFFKSRIGLLGYYTSGSEGKGTTDLYQSHLSLNVYPLAWFNLTQSRLQPYLVGGMAYDQFRFYGFYLNREPGHTNYSVGEAPLLGKMTAITGSYGAGLDLRLKDEWDFVHVFVEYRQGRTMSASSASDAFADTRFDGRGQFLAGVSFGAFR